MAADASLLLVLLPVVLEQVRLHGGPGVAGVLADVAPEDPEDGVLDVKPSVVGRVLLRAGLEAPPLAREAGARTPQLQATQREAAGKRWEGGRKDGRQRRALPEELRRLRGDDQGGGGGRLPRPERRRQRPCSHPGVRGRDGRRAEVHMGHSLGHGPLHRGPRRRRWRMGHGGVGDGSGGAPSRGCPGGCVPPVDEPPGEGLPGDPGRGRGRDPHGAAAARLVGSSAAGGLRGGHEGVLGHVVDVAGEGSGGIPGEIQAIDDVDGEDGHGGEGGVEVGRGLFSPDSKIDYPRQGCQLPLGTCQEVEKGNIFICLTWSNLIGFSAGAFFGAFYRKSALLEVEKSGYTVPAVARL